MSEEVFEAPAYVQSLSRTFLQKKADMIQKRNISQLKL